MTLNDGEQISITDFLGQIHAYEVICPLGDGYLADVYLMQALRARTGFSRGIRTEPRQKDRDPVVVKVLKRRHIDAANKTSDFLQEADFLQQLAERPDVVKLRPPGKGEIVLNEQTRLPCILQEYVQAPYRPLPELVEAGLSEQTGLEICRQFASLLDYVHAHGIIYTDLKPEHIYWNGTQIKVIDWNVTKDLSAADDDTFHAAVAKQLAAFGQVMYYLFTGRSTVKRTAGPSITTLISDTAADTHINFGTPTTGETLSLKTKLIIEHLLQANTELGQSESNPSHYPTTVAALEQTLAQHALALSQAPPEGTTRTRAAVSKGLAAMEAGDYEDAVAHFEEAVFSTPGLITQSHLVAARVRQDDDVPDSVKDQVEGNLALFRMAFQDGDLTTALDALSSSQTAMSGYRDLEVLHQLTNQVVQAISQMEEALAAADYAQAQQALRRAQTLEPSAAFLQEQLETIEVFATHLDTGQQALAAGQFAEAAAAFDTLLDHMPRSDAIEEQWLAAKLGEAQAALERSALTEAQRACEAVLERQPENDEARAGLEAVEAGRQRLQQLESWLSQGRTALRTGDYEKALQYIDEVLKLEPEHAGARQLLDDVQEAQRVRRSRRVGRLLEKGQQALAEGAHMEAIQCFEQAAELDPESEADVLRARAEAAHARTDRFQALLHKAHAAFRGENYHTAVQYFEEAIDLQPEAIDARRGLTLARQRQAEVKAQEVQNLLARGRAALGAGDYDAALCYFEQASELGSEAEIAHHIEKTYQVRDLIQSAQAAQERGDFREAIAYYSRAVEIEPLPHLEQQLAQIRARAYAASQEQADQLIEQAAAHLDSAPAQAIAWLEQVQELAPGHERVTELLAEAREHLQRQQMELRRLLDTGEAALYAGDSATAEQAFADALALDPEHIEAQAGHAQVQQLQQHLAAAEGAANRERYEEAAAELAQAVEIAPDSAHIRQLWQQTQCDALLQQARRAAEAGDYTAALMFVDQARSVNADYTAEHALTQVIQVEAEEAQQAEEVVAHQARIQEVEALMATADAQLGRYEYHAALQAMESALEMMPDSTELANRRREIARRKARQDRARTLMEQGRRLERQGHYAEAAEAYEIAAHLAPNPGFEDEAHARVEQAQRNHRQQRWYRFLRRIFGFPLAAEE